MIGVSFSESLCGGKPVHRRDILGSGLAALAASSLPAPARAAPVTSLNFGRATEHSSIDPHFSQTGPNQSTAAGIFERLVGFTADNQIRPCLGLSWTARDPLNWEIKLRPGVVFHDGSPMTAADVAYSLERVRHIPRSPAPFTHAVTSVAAVEIADPLTLRIRTTEPTPLLMQQIGLVYVIPAKLGPDVGNDDFNSGRAAIGTGPYRYVSWTPNDRAVMRANPTWWGGKADFAEITLRFIPNSPARIAALLSGQVDLIDAVSPTDAVELAHKPDITLFSSATNRIIYLALDAAREVSPFVTDNAGKPLAKNPLQDLRVRQALSGMVNREVIVNRLLNGAAVPAGQMVPEGEGGYSNKLPPTPFDIKAAREKLAQAGYPDGFGVTIHSSSDRYPADGQVAQAAGQMFARAGLHVNGVEALPYNVFAPPRPSANTACSCSAGAAAPRTLPKGCAPSSPPTTPGTATAR